MLKFNFKCYSMNCNVTFSSKSNYLKKNYFKLKCLRKRNSKSKVNRLLFYFFGILIQNYSFLFSREWRGVHLGALSFYFFIFIFSLHQLATCSIREKEQINLAVGHSESTLEFVIIHSKLDGIPNLVFASL